jgi:alpha-beta hydrolase superfamily lysophospholipase
MSEAPGPAEPTTITTIPVKGGALYAEHFIPAVPARGIVVVSHGYAEHCGRYHELANVIARAGWIALLYDVRGHGRSLGKRGFVEHFSDFLDDFTAVLRAARALVPPEAPMVLLGHSHGSLITLRALCDDRPPPPAMKVTHAIVSSPFLGLRLQVPAWKRGLARIASRIVPTLTLPNDLRAEDLTNDKAMQQARIADKICFDIATARWFTEAGRAQDYVEAHADRIAVPTTWLVGHDDPIADAAKSKRIAAKVRGADFHDLVGLKHEVFNEVDRGKVFDVVRAVLATP